MARPSRVVSHGSRWVPRSPRFGLISPPPGVPALAVETRLCGCRRERACMAESNGGKNTNGHSVATSNAGPSGAAQNARYVGIDLGTTYCAMSWLDAHGTPVTITNA